MVLVLGLDRVDGTPQSGMPDALWASHTAELQSRFLAQASDEAALDFTAFCGTFSQGGISTEAMRAHVATQLCAPNGATDPRLPTVNLAIGSKSISLDRSSKHSFALPSPAPLDVSLLQLSSSTYTGLQSLKLVSSGRTLEIYSGESSSYVTTLRGVQVDLSPDGVAASPASLQ